MNIFLQSLFLTSFFLFFFTKHYKIFSITENLIFTIALNLSILKTQDSQNFFIVIFSLFYPFSLSSFIELISLVEPNYFYYINFFTQENNYKILLEIILCFLIFVIVQLICFKYFGKNIKRKNFHFLAFFIFKKQNIIIFKLSFYVLIIAVAIIKMKLVRKYFNFLLKSKNQESDEFSFFILIISIIIPHYFLNSKDFMRLLISLCIMDSMASITGNSFNKKTKSILGFISGQIASYIFEFYYLGDISFLYHLIIGIIEFYTVSNDNLIISFSSCFYSLIF